MRKRGRHEVGKNDTISFNSDICNPLNFLFKELAL